MTQRQLQVIKLEILMDQVVDELLSLAQADARWLEQAQHMELVVALSGLETAYEKLSGRQLRPLVDRLAAARANRPGR